MKKFPSGKVSTIYIQFQLLFSTLFFSIYLKLRLTHALSSDINANTLENAPLQYTYCLYFKVPAFETGDGKYLTDSNAIAYYVANQQLRGNTELERAQVLQWFGFAETEILPAACAWVFPVLGIIAYNKQVNVLVRRIYILSQRRAWLN